MLASSNWNWIHDLQIANPPLFLVSQSCLFKHFYVFFVKENKNWLCYSDLQRAAQTPQAFLAKTSSDLTAKIFEHQFSSFARLLDLGLGFD